MYFSSRGDEILYMDGENQAATTVSAVDPGDDPAALGPGCRVIAVVNQKGGVGKTTTAVNLAACLAVAEEPTLLVDLDPQSNATSAFGLNGDDPALYRALVLGEPVPEESLQLIDIKCVTVLGSSIDLVGAELDLADLPGGPSGWRPASPLTGGGSTSSSSTVPPRSGFSP